MWIKKVTPAILFSLVFFLLWSGQWSGQMLPGENRIAAQTTILEESTTVTAIVADHIAPSTPILISPADESRLNSGYVQFVWQESTDNWLMGHYTLVLNGVTKFDNIPLTATQTDDYILTYEPSTGYFRLQLKTNRLNDGSYTWSIVAYDFQGNLASSVTWDFVIDTKAPSFIITEVEKQTVQITAGNVESVPIEPLEVTVTQPLLAGNGEVAASVELTITDRDGKETKQYFVVDANGKWAVTLDALPRDQIISLDFLIIDPTGNINVLDDVLLIVGTPVVVVPLPSLPPITLPGLPPIVVPPQLEVPVLPPAEYLPPVIRQAPKQIVYYVRDYSVKVSTKVVSLIERLWMISVLLALLALPITKLISLMVAYRQYFSAELMKQLLWFIGWWHEQMPAGIVLDKNTQMPIDQSLVFISGKTSQQETKRWVLLTNQAGIFPQLPLPEGEYRISVQHPNFFFPSLAPRPAHLDQNTFYTGAVIQVKNGSWLPLLTIPVEPLQKQQHNWFYALKSQYLALPSLSIPMAVTALVIAATFPTILNILSLLVYLGLLGKKYYLLRRKNCQFLTVLADKSPRSGVVIVATPVPVATNHPGLIMQTSPDGILDCYLKPADYQLQVIDFRHSLAEGDHKTLTEFKAEATGNYLPLVLVSDLS